jgi:hypothetical protein
MLYPKRATLERYLSARIRDRTFRQRFGEFSMHAVIVLQKLSLYLVNLAINFIHWLKCIIVEYDYIVILFSQITQISCYDNNRLAPSGCTQYYMETSGTIQSFNWVTNSANNVQLANQNQRICFRCQCFKTSCFCSSKSSKAEQSIMFIQGSLTEGEGSVWLTSLYLLV